jgi:glutathione S-transferase
MKSFAKTTPEPAVMAFLKGRIDAAMAIVDQRLSSQPFMLGDSPTIVDFSLGGYMFYPVEESGYDLRAVAPNIHAWTERLRALPRWRDPYELMPGARMAPLW